jgi:pilus assembly protein CpaC
MPYQSHARCVAFAHRIRRTARLGGALALVTLIVAGTATAQQYAPGYYPPTRPAQPSVASQYGSPDRNAPVAAYYASGPDANSDGRPQPHYVVPAVVQASYAASFRDNRAAVAPPAEGNLPNPQAASYATEVVRPLPLGNEYPNTADNTIRLAQNTDAPEVIRPAAAAPAGEQPPTAPAEPASENRFLGLLPAAGPPPAIGPVPSPQAAREYDRFVEGAILPDNTLKVIVGRAVVIVTHEKPRRVYIPNEDFATAQIITDRQVAVVGKKEGRTTLDLWFPDPSDPNNPAKDKALSYLVVVLRDTGKEEYSRWSERQRIEAEVEAFRAALKILQGQIKETFPDSAVQLSLIGEQVIVRGEAKDIVEAAQILSIVAEHAPISNRRRGIGAYAGRGANVNVNLGYGAGPQGAALNALQSLNASGLSLNAGGPGVEQAALSAIQQILTGAPNVVNLLRVPGEQQVMLMVTVAEVNRTAARTIGMDFSIVHGGFAFAQTTGGNLTSAAQSAAGQITGTASPAAMALSQVGGNLPTAIDNGNVLMAIQALRTLDFARSLAEPNLTTLNGRPANFQAGGSFPIPNSVITPGGAAQSVTYQNFGVALEFTPYITDRNRIRLQLNASVSTPSVATTQVSGAQVPSQITQRQFNTTVEMREGQTLTVAGLIQNNFSGTSKRVPLWGDLPIIGRTGGSDSLSSGEQELVVLVTPVLVHPLEMCKTPPLPGNNIFEPGDVEFYLMGHLEGRRSEDYRTSVRTDFERQKKWCSCDDVYIIGPHGATYGCCRSCACQNMSQNVGQAPRANSVPPANSIPPANGVAPLPPETIVSPKPQ